MKLRLKIKLRYGWLHYLSVPPVYAMDKYLNLLSRDLNSWNVNKVLSTFRSESIVSLMDERVWYRHIVTT